MSTPDPPPITRAFLSRSSPSQQGSGEFIPEVKQERPRSGTWTSGGITEWAQQFSKAEKRQWTSSSSSSLQHGRLWLSFWSDFMVVINVLLLLWRQSLGEPYWLPALGLYSCQYKIFINRSLKSTEVNVLHIAYSYDLGAKCYRTAIFRM